MVLLAASQVTRLVSVTARRGNRFSMLEVAMAIDALSGRRGVVNCHQGVAA